MRILHVEDDPDIREIAALAFALSPEVELRQCSSGPEALEVAPTFDADLFLLDVMMPGMSGVEVLAQLRDAPATADVPAVFMTARVQPSEVKELEDKGAAGVIVKPFDPMTLADQLKSIVG